MKKLTISAIICAITTFANAEKVWEYIGIPYVTDNVPDEIMPILPDGADAPGWPYDPCGMPTPTFNNGLNQYYVDTANGNDSNAGNSGRGSVTAPRKSLPNFSNSTWSISSGDQIFITANSELFLGGDDIRVESNGSSSNICWIIGVGGKPTFGNDKLNLHGQHLVIDNILFTNDEGMRIKIGNSTGHSYISYFTIRNCILDGNGNGKNAAIGGGGLSPTEKCSFICIYNNVIRELGDWDRQDADGKDKHGIQPVGYSDHWWIIENEIYHCEGDSIQINSSRKDNGIYESRPHYMYIAGNHMYENYENAIDNKNTFHCISSENVIHGFHNDYKGANETSIILANDSEGWLSGYEWAIFNTIYDVGQGIKIASTAASIIDDKPAQVEGDKVYAIGNLIYDAKNGFELDARGTNQDGELGPTWFEETWIVNNTIVVNSGNPIRQSRGNTEISEPGTHSILGNVVYNSGSETEIELDSNEKGQTNDVRYNVLYRTSGVPELTSSNFNLNIGNILNANPLFEDAANGNYKLSSSSPAIDVNGFDSTPAPYLTFMDLYGIDIRVDKNGNPRPVGERWDAGAFEYGESNPNIPTNPTALQVAQ